MSLLTDYKVKVLKSIAVKDGKAIYNGSVEHASVLTECAFLTANKKINILTNQLDGEAYNRPDLISAAASYLNDKDHKLKVLIEDGNAVAEESHGFYSTFKHYDNVEFRIVPEEIIEQYSYNFYVMDGDSYRFEEDRTRPEAVASFGGDTEAAENLNDIFNAIWNHSEDIH